MGLDVDQLHADFCLGHRAVGEQVDQAVFLGVELFQLTVEAGVPVADGGVFVGDDFFEEPSGLGGVRDQLVTDSAKTGWATMTIPLALFKAFARERGWEAVATRRGGATPTLAHLAT
ncbi:hypothetical protein [Nocardia sp. NPDC051981]|uniref:hypothetical protein n=1 Tax=Nocardia sp. NPDC051981 TaxID=3155417 RepID=UPI003449F1FE